MSANEEGKATSGASSAAESVKLIAGLIAVGIGSVVVGIVAVVALLKGGDTAAQVSSAVAGVIATMVGAYFGVKVGSDQTKQAIAGQQAEAAKAQVYAAHVPAAEADKAIGLAEKAAVSAAVR
ncbi:MAG TPA: hypothetical protein VH268_03555 [Solirubrobacterales bacterium]|nr:hypothetical protein [Solirubrobacterales bacterium]